MQRIEDKKTQLSIMRKEQILSAAKRVFARYGYRLTKTEMICNEIGVGKGTLYRYFQDKNALFLSIFEAGMSELKKQMTEKALPLQDPRKRICTAARTYFEFLDNDRDFIEIMMQVRSEFKDFYMQYWQKQYSEYILNIQRTLKEGVSQGLFRIVDVEKTADAISAIIQGTLQNFYMKQQVGCLADNIDAVSSLILKGVLINSESPESFGGGRQQ